MIGLRLCPARIQRLPSTFRIDRYSSLAKDATDNVPMPLDNAGVLRAYQKALDYINICLIPRDQEPTLNKIILPMILA